MIFFKKLTIIIFLFFFGNNLIGISQNAYDKGYQAYLSANFNEAAKYWSFYLDTNQNLFVLYDRGLAYYYGNEYRKALKDFEDCITNADSLKLTNKGLIYDSKQKYNKVYEVLLKNSFIFRIMDKIGLRNNEFKSLN